MVGGGGGGGGDCGRTGSASDRGSSGDGSEGGGGDGGRGAFQRTCSSLTLKDAGGVSTREQPVQPLLREAIVNRTYGRRANPYIHLFLISIFGPIYYGPP